MKRTILTAITVLVALVAAPAHAEEPSLTMLISGGEERDVLDIKLSPDGRDYVVDSLSPLEVGGVVCTHPEAVENRLLCSATAISGFEVNAGGGGDSVIVSPKVQIPVTLRGGPGDDRLYGGAGADKLVGGSGADTLIGRSGNDSLFGGEGDDSLFGGPGDDLLRGGSGLNESVGGPGHNSIL